MKGVLVDTAVWVDHFRNRNENLVSLLTLDLIRRSEKEEGAFSRTRKPGCPYGARAAALGSCATGRCGAPPPGHRLPNLEQPPAKRCALRNPNAKRCVLITRAKNPIMEKLKISVTQPK